MSDITLYIVECDSNTLERIWYYTQYSGLANFPMYKARVSKANSAWIVEVPLSKQGTLFTIQFSEYLTSVNGLYYA